MKHLIYMVFAMLMLASCSSDEPKNEPNTPPQAEPIELGRSEQEIVDAQKKFAVSFFKTVCKSEDPRENIIVSPLSMSLAFSMVANGAQGETCDQIADAFGFKSEDIAALNTLNRTLLERLPSVDPSTKLAIANSFWTTIGAVANPDFSRFINENYSADIFSANLYGIDGMNAVNEWVSEKTERMIPSMLEKPLEADFALCNALYFNGEWSKKFDNSKTISSKFHNSDGSDSDVDMMNVEENLKCLFELKESDGKYDMDNDRVMAVKKQYGNGAYHMTVILPPQNIPMSEFISSLDESSLASITDKLSYRKVSLKLPRFECEYGKDLVNELRALGIRKAFSDEAEISGILENNVKLTKAIQKTKIKVNESGTEVASGTVVAGQYTADMPVKITFDRPFMYYISEQSTGAILFMGCVNAF